MVYKLHELDASRARKIIETLPRGYYVKVNSGHFSGSVGKVISILNTYSSARNKKLSPYTRIQIKVENNRPFTCYSRDCEFYEKKTKEVYVDIRKTQLDVYDIFNRKLEKDMIIMSVDSENKICIGQIKKFNLKTIDTVILKMDGNKRVQKRRFKKSNSFCILDNELDDFILMQKLKTS